MRTFLRRLACDFEKNILCMIGDFAGSWCFVDKSYPVCRIPTGEYHRLRFKVTRRRHLGRIFVERVCPVVGVVERKWLKKTHWVPSYDICMLMQCKALQSTLHSLSRSHVNVDTKHLHLQIKVCRNAIDCDALLII